MKSMTGYGRGSWEGSGCHFQVELRSVNNRFLSIRTRLPDSFFCFENMVESCLRSQLNRGSIVCQVRHRQTEALAGLSKEVLLSSFKELSAFAQDNKIPGNVDMALLTSLSHLSSSNESQDNMDALETGLTEALSDALKDLMNMRQKEGLALKEQLLSLSEDVRAFVDQVETLSRGLVSRHQARFRQRVESLLKDIDYDDVALSRELALLADRADISEELIRLKSHLNQFGSLLNKEGPVGRKLDFLLQEVNREINTIGSKSSEVELSQLVIDLKSSVEMIREQVQNVE